MLSVALTAVRLWIPHDWDPRSGSSDLYRCDVGAVTAASPYGFSLERSGRDGVDLHTQRGVKGRVMLAPDLRHSCTSTSNMSSRRRSSPSFNPSRTAALFLYFCKMFAVKDTRQICRSGAALRFCREQATLED